MDTTADAYMYAGVRMMADWVPSAVNILSALLTPAIGVTTVYIAYRQWKTDRLRLRHEQYERRATVFRGVLGHLSAILRRGAVMTEWLADYVGVTSEKEFLFEKELCDYLEEIYKRTLACWALDEANRALQPGDPKKAEIVDRQVAELKWLSDQIPELRDRFAKYLRLG